MCITININITTILTNYSSKMTVKTKTINMKADTIILTNNSSAYATAVAFSSIKTAIK